MIPGQPNFAQTNFDPMQMLDHQQLAAAAAAQMAQQIPLNVDPAQSIINVNNPVSMNNLTSVNSNSQANNISQANGLLDANFNQLSYNLMANGANVLNNNLLTGGTGGLDAVNSNPHLSSMLANPILGGAGASDIYGGQGDGGQQGQGLRECFCILSKIR